MSWYIDDELELLIIGLNADVEELKEWWAKRQARSDGVAALQCSACHE